MKEKLATFRDKIGAKAIVRGVEDVESLQEDLKGLVELFKEFKEERLASSKMFVFWKEYCAMVDLLLQFIKAERTANWKLHVSAVAAMTPYFFAMDRCNYARWLPIYLADMNQVADKHPEVYREFMNDNHVDSRPSNPFS